MRYRDRLCIRNFSCWVFGNPDSLFCALFPKYRAAKFRKSASRLRERVIPMNRHTLRHTIAGVLYALLLIVVASVGHAQTPTPKVNTHDASIPHATKTTKSNLRKAGGDISKGSRHAGHEISQASRNVQKQVSRTFHKKP